MIVSHPKVNQLMGGWYVQYTNGEVLTQNDCNWIKVPNKKNIKIMGLKWRHKHYELSDKLAYIPPGETLQKDLAIGNKGIRTVSNVVGRFIGYYSDDKKIIIRVNFKTGKFTKEEIPYS